MSAAKQALTALAALCACAEAQAEDKGQQIAPALYMARDIDSTIYLFGTVHVRPRGAPWGGAEARDALAAAGDVWTELDLSPEAEQETARLVRELGAAPPGRPLSSWLAPEEAERLRAAALRLGLDPPAFENTRPWLAALTLTLAPIMQAGFDPASGVDRAIDAEADSMGKARRYFETPEQQVRFLANLSDAAQRQMLLEAIDEFDEGPDVLADLTRAWERGDTAALEALVLAPMREDYPELYEALFRARNAAWIETLMRELDGWGVDFVAVGAGHLVGADGVLALLEARGVRLERVTSRAAPVSR